MSTRRKFLDQKLVTEFAEFRAFKTKIEKWLKQTREVFLEEFEKGFACPLDGPYLLVLEPNERSAVNWKQEFFLQLKTGFEALGKPCDEAETLAVSKMAEIEMAAGKKTVIELAIKVNPSHASKPMAAIVKKLDSRTARGF
jgi:hypothetical protein